MKSCSRLRSRPVGGASGVYGSEVVICRLTAEAGWARLHLIKVLEDRVISGGATEFTIPRIATYAVIDLRAAR
jgi:hypothetical protein